MNQAYHKFTHHELKTTRYHGGENMTKVKVTGSHEVSVIRDIEKPDMDESNIVRRLKKGETLSVDTSHVYWDSYDRQYYKVDIGRNFDTFVATGGVRVV
jgi:hypothetical protein